MLLTIERAHAQFIRFENFSDEQGLGNISVSALAQDADGYMLLGTEAGLYRYDGTSIVPYDVAVGLPSGAWFRKIITDRAGRVWAAISDGIYVRHGSVFSKVDVGRTLDLRSPHLLAVTDDHVYLDDSTLR